MKEKKEKRGRDFLKKVESQVDFFRRTSLSSMSVERGGLKITLEAFESGGSAPLVGKEVLPSNSNAPFEQGRAEEKESRASRYKEVKSPITGTFYAASSPNEDPFVKEGDDVQEGDVLCVVESMKVMNQIKSPFIGKVVKVIVKNGEKVNKGQNIIYIE